MQVFVELSLLENFCMDYTLLYCAKLVSKNRAGWRRIALGSALGACFAVVFPLFKLNAWLSVVIKLLSGLALCAISGRFSRFKSFLTFTGAFAGFSFALGGGLIAIFALAGSNIKQGNGFVLSSVPIGIPMFFALLLIIFARKLKKRLTKSQKSEVEIKLYSGGESVSLSGFFDSGNRVSYRGSPVSVIPLSAALKIVDEACISSAVKIHTVTGSKKLKVFTAEKMEIIFADKVSVINNATLGIGPANISAAVLHPDLMEE